METLQKFGPVVSRIFLATIFLVSGYGKIAGFQQTADFMASAGLPGNAAFVVLVIVVEIGAAIMLLLGYKTRLAALALIGFTVLATLFFHLGAGQATSFLKNLAIIGGLLSVMTYGAGPVSLDNEYGGWKRTDDGMA